MRRKVSSYLYNYYDKDDGKGCSAIIDIGGYKVQIGINVVILPGFRIKPNKNKAGQITIVGSNSFLGVGEALEEGSVSPEGTILGGEPLAEDELDISVILVADDLGRKPENNTAIINCFRAGFLHHSSLMVNRRESTENAIKTFRGTPYEKQIGLHFNVTEGYSLSRMAAEEWYSVNVKGNLGSIIAKKRTFFFLYPSEKRVIEDELRQQVAVFKSWGLSLRYFDSHGNIHFKLPVAKLVSRVMKSEGHVFVRIPRDEGCRHLLYSRLIKPRVARIYRKRFRTVDFFLNSRDIFKTDLRKYKHKVLEIMLHPYMDNGLLTNRRDVSLDVLMSYFQSRGIKIVKWDNPHGGD